MLSGIEIFMFFVSDHLNETKRLCLNHYSLLLDDVE